MVTQNAVNAIVNRHIVYCELSAGWILLGVPSVSGRGAGRDPKGHVDEGKKGRATERMDGGSAE